MIHRRLRLLFCRTAVLCLVGLPCVASVFYLAACDIQIVAQTDPRKTPTADRPTPAPQIPTPEPQPIQEGNLNPISSGWALIEVRNVLGPNYTKGDTKTFLTFRGESGRIIELSFRGTVNKTCESAAGTRTPCNVKRSALKSSRMQAAVPPTQAELDSQSIQSEESVGLVGLTLRASCNLSADSAASAPCSVGTNFHYRQPLGPFGPAGETLVWLWWDNESITIGTGYGEKPARSLTYPLPGPCMALNRWDRGVPADCGRRGCGLSLPQWDGVKIGNGMAVNLLKYEEAGFQHLPESCP